MRVSGMPLGDLVDAGAILATVDVSDRWHRRCLEALPHIRLPLVTTSAVLTEVFYFAVKRGRFRQAVWDFVRSSRIRVAPIDNTDLPAIEALMARYADRPMDFADATLVHVAGRQGLSTVFTIDHSDFETYRIGRRAKFRILPAR